MAALGSLADRALDQLKAGDYRGLAQSTEENFSLRRSLYGDEVVGARNIAMAELAKCRGFSAKFTGSGGALLCLRSDGINSWLRQEEEDSVIAEFATRGFSLVRIRLPLDERVE
jgi:glucuronokinase